MRLFETTPVITPDPSLKVARTRQLRLNVYSARSAICNEN